MPTKRKAKTKTKTKPKRAKFSAVTRPEYDASRTESRSGKHLRPGVLLRATQSELDGWSRCAEAAGLSRSEWLRGLAAREVARSDSLGPEKNRHHDPV